MTSAPGTSLQRPVDLFVCGVQKGGTNTLFHYLSAHPQISRPLKNEVHFFDDETVDWDNPDYRILHSHYSHEDGKFKFDNTPAYSFWKPAMGRIKEYNGSAKLLFLFRDPTDRAFSHWSMQAFRKRESLSFSEAIRAEADRLSHSAPLSETLRRQSYLSRGLYYEQLSRALTFFDKKQIMSIASEDFWKDVNRHLQMIADFLQIAPFEKMNQVHLFRGRTGPGAPPMSKDDFAFMKAYFRDDVRAFTALSGLDTSRWPTCRG